jgi:CheY-like chemotaxis protein
VIDDDQHKSPAIQRWLKRSGFRIAVADGNLTGLVALGHSAFDLMIVDIFMPHMRGFEPIRVFHDRAPNVPLIANSGSAFMPATLSCPIDECLSEAEPHRKCVATRFRVVEAVSGPRDKAAVLGVPIEETFMD